jgi:hypothetical protein
MKMLLKQLIESPMNSSKLLVCDPFRQLDPEELVTEVIGLANADVDAPGTSCLASMREPLTAVESLESPKAIWPT